MYRIKYLSEKYASDGLYDWLWHHSRQLRHSCVLKVNILTWSKRSKMVKGTMPRIKEHLMLKYTAENSVRNISVLSHTEIRFALMCFFFSSNFTFWKYTAQTTGCQQLWKNTHIRCKAPQVAEGLCPQNWQRGGAGFACRVRGRAICRSFAHVNGCFRSCWSRSGFSVVISETSVNTG